MNSIKISIRLEMTELCFSPVTWLILLVFALQNNYVFTEQINSIVALQEIHGGGNAITQNVFSSAEGLFGNIRNSLFWYVPLLTMNILSKEFNVGTDKLLFSSPIRVWQIVLSKYLSLLVLGLVLLCSLIPVLIEASLLIEHFDYGIIFSGLLGIFLLFSIYAAIGMFMSSLTSRAVLAGIGTFSILMLLDSIAHLGQYSPFFRNITYWLSIRGRASTMIEGLILSEDVFYFLILSMLFMGCTMLSIFRRQVSGNWVRLSAAYAAMAAIAGGLAYMTQQSKMSFSLDTTSTHENTLSPTSRNILETIEGPVWITAYVNMADYNCWLGVPSNINDDQKQYRNYLRVKPDIQFKYVYYEDEPYHNLDYKDPTRLPTQEMARMFCEHYHLDRHSLLKGEDLRKIYKKIDLKKERNTFLRLIESPGNKTSSILRVYDDMQIQPSEAEISIAFKKLATPSPRIAYVSGFGGRTLQEGMERSYQPLFYGKFIRNSAINQGFDIEEINLMQISTDSLIGNFDILVLPDIRKPLDPSSQKKIEDYIDAGRNLLAFCEFDQAASQFILKKLGLHYLPGELLYPQQAITPDVIPAEVSPFFTQLSPKLFPGSLMLMPSCGALDYDMGTPYEIYPFLQTQLDKCIMLHRAQLLGNEADSGMQEIGAGITKQHLYNTALGLSRQMGEGREQRIVVTADADFISHKTLSTPFAGFDAANSKFVSASLYWLSCNQAPLIISRPGAKDNFIGLKLAEMDVFKAKMIYPVPAFFLLLGTVLILRRNSR